jgi:3-methyladenine DNA glycosylase AlkD
LTSEVTSRAQALVAEKLPEARGLGAALADLIDYPEEFLAALEDGLRSLTDDAYAVEMARVVPGDATDIPVRLPLVQAAARQLTRPLRESSPASAISLAQRLADAEARSVRLFALVPLARALESDPERSWQLLRRMSRACRDWVSVDSLASLYARGILLERVRWAEIEQLVFSQSEWERRLVGATIATLPMRATRSEKLALANSPALGLIRSLMGDAADTVQKSLGWALRQWREIDPRGVDELLRTEAATAAKTNDGHRARVIRDALKEARFTAPSPLAASLRAQLAGVRRTARGDSTSEASDIAGRFKGLERLSDEAASQQGDRQRYFGARYGQVR